MSRWPRRARALAVVLALSLAGLMLGAGRLMVVERIEPDPDAILVLASHEFERLPLAWQYAVRHPRATVVLSYPAAPTPANCQACAHRVDLLVSWGLPRSRIHLMETLVWNSRDELLAVAALARERRWTSVQVVTSTYHTRRVAGLSRAVAGEDGLPRFGVVGASEPPANPVLWWSRRYDGRYVLYEAAALVANGWRYGIWPWEWRVLDAPGRTKPGRSG